MSLRFRPPQLCFRQCLHCRRRPLSFRQRASRGQHLPYSLLHRYHERHPTYSLRSLRRWQRRTLTLPSLRRRSPRTCLRWSARLLQHLPHHCRRLHWPKRRWCCRNLRHRPPAFRYHPVQMMPPQLPNFRHLRMLPNLRSGPHSWRPPALRRCHPSRSTPAGRSMSPSCPPA